MADPTYDAANDRIVIPNDPGSNLTFRFQMRAHIPTTVVGPSDITTLTLTSTQGGAAVPFTVGHAFVQGQIGGTGAGATTPYITSSLGVEFQAHVRNRWPDGSVKFAVLSGRQNLTANVAGTPITIQKTGTAPGGVNVPEPAASSYQQGQPNAIVVTLGGAIANPGAYTPFLAAQAGLTPWTQASHATTPRKVRQFLGPIMSEFHYFQPVTAHVAIWWYVRAYLGGKIEVETVVENGWTNVAGAGSTSYNVDMQIGATFPLTTAITHLHHTRWSRVDWIGTLSPQVTPAHNTAYLRSTKMVPNYGWTSPTSAAYTSNWVQTENVAPFQHGVLDDDYSAGGGGEWITIIPKWDALYCTAADARAYRASLGEARIMGRFGHHFRDEVTGRCVNYLTQADYPGFSVPLLSSDFDSSQRPVAASGTPPPKAEVPHHGSFGYLQYLVSGRWSMLEELQMLANYVFLRPDRQGRGVIRPHDGVHSMRGGAWTWRSVGQAAGISPTEIVGDTAVQAGFASAIEASMSYIITNDINIGGASAEVGLIGYYDENGGPGWENSGTDTYNWNRNWMISFQVLSLAHISDLGIPNITQVNLATVRNHAYKGIIRMFVPGTNAQWNWRNSTQYDVPYKNNVGAILTTAQSYAVFTAIYGGFADADPALAHYAAGGVNSASVESNTGEGYTMYKLSALNWAVEHGVTNAQAALTQLSQATNLPHELPPNDPADIWHNDPRWAIVHR